MFKASLDPGALLNMLANLRSGIFILGKDIPIFLQLLCPENARKNIKHVYKEKKSRSRRWRENFVGTPVKELVPVPTQPISADLQLPEDIYEVQHYEGPLAAAYVRHAL